MKKSLLTLGAIALAGSMMAETVTFDFVANDYGMTRLSGNVSTYNPDNTVIEEGGVKLTSYITNSGSGTRLWADGLRFYKGGNLKIEAEGAQITNVEILTSTDAAVSMSSFAWDPATSETNVWKGAADSVVLTYTATSKNVAVGKMVVTYSVANPDLKPSGLQFATTTFETILGEEFVAPELVNPNNLTVAYTSSNPEVAVVDAATGAVTIVAAGTTTITAASEATAEFNAGTASYKLVVVKGAKTLAEWMALCPNSGDQGVLNFQLTVVYVNGSSIYVTDGTTSGLLYGANTYAAGDLLEAGWIGKFSPYSGLPEITPVNGFPAVVETVEVPTFDTVASVSEADMNRIVILSNVTFDDATPDTKANFTGTLSDGSSLAFRNNFLTDSVAAGTYNVTVAVGIYSNTLQVYPISYEVASGVETIAASAADAIYFNMQGQRIANPENGMFIRVAGGEAVKVML